MSQAERPPSRRLAASVLANAQASAGPNETDAEKRRPCLRRVSAEPITQRLPNGGGFRVAVHQDDGHQAILT